MQERARSSIMTLVQAKGIYTPPLFCAAKGLWYIKLKFHCNSKSVRKRKRLDFRLLGFIARFSALVNL